MPWLFCEQTVLLSSVSSTTSSIKFTGRKSKQTKQNNKKKKVKNKNQTSFQKGTEKTSEAYTGLRSLTV